MTHTDNMLQSCIANFVSKTGLTLTHENRQNYNITCNYLKVKDHDSSIYMWNESMNDAFIHPKAHAWSSRQMACISDAWMLPSPVLHGGLDELCWSEHVPSGEGSCQRGRQFHTQWRCSEHVLSLSPRLRLKHTNVNTDEIYFHINALHGNSHSWQPIACYACHSCWK